MDPFPVPARVAHQWVAINTQPGDCFRRTDADPYVVAERCTSCHQTRLVPKAPNEYGPYMEENRVAWHEAAHERVMWDGNEACPSPVHLIAIGEDGDSNETWYRAGCHPHNHTYPATDQAATLGAFALIPPERRCRVCTGIAAKAIAISAPGLATDMLRALDTLLHRAALARGEAAR